MLDLTDRTHCFYWQTDRILSGEEYVRIFLKRHEESSDMMEKILLNGIKTVKSITSLEIIPPDENVLKGNVNIVRKVILNGKPYIVRMHPRGVKNGYFYAEKCALHACKLKGIPVPRILEIYEAKNEDDMDFMLCSLTPGINMDIYLRDHADAEQQLLVCAGKQMATIHSIRVEGFGFFNNQIAKEKNELVGIHKNYHDFIWSGLEENLDRLVGFNILTTLQADKIKQIFITMNFEPIGRPCLVHNDMADWNLLTDGTELTGVLDWDECHAGDPIADLACWSTFYSIERLEQFLKGYMMIQTLPKDYDKRFHYYRLRYTISKMALRCKRYQVDKADFILQKIEIGKQALIEESAWFHL